MYLTISPGEASKTGRSLGIALPSFYADQFNIEKGDDGCAAFGLDHIDRSFPDLTTRCGGEARS